MILNLECGHISQIQRGREERGMERRVDKSQCGRESSSQALKLTTKDSEGKNSKDDEQIVKMRESMRKS